jgi:hypothetical protein
MSRSRIAIIACVYLLAAATGSGAEPTVMVASGVVSKATGDVLIVNPPNAEGRFGSAMALKGRGTSNLPTLTTQDRGGQLIMLQKEVSPAFLQPNQPIAVIFVALRDDNILLAAVVQTK